MARKITHSAPSHLPPVLTETRNAASSKLQMQIEKGQEICLRELGSTQDVESARREMTNWSEYNTELLLRLFDSAVVSQEYKTALHATGSISLSLYGPSLQSEVNDFHKTMNRRIDKLRSIQGRLSLIPEPAGLADVYHNQINPALVENSKKVFIVHGHDEAAKLAVSRFLERIELIPVVLHEQANASMTIIEKFEANCDVQFAVILLTPDDICTQKDGGEAYRARQNVIFELGFFVGRIGRKKVCALKKNDVEINSDIHGVTYVPMDDAGAWKMDLARELNHAGIDFDAKKLL